MTRKRERPARIESPSPSDARRIRQQHNFATLAHAISNTNITAPNTAKHLARIAKQMIVEREDAVETAIV